MYVTLFILKKSSKSKTTKSNIIPKKINAILIHFKAKSLKLHNLNHACEKNHHMHAKGSGMSIS